MATKLTNFKKDGNLIKMQFQNSKTTSVYPIALINSIRRTALADIENYAIDKESMEVIENTSVLNADEIALRLKLIPLDFDEISKIDLNELTLELNVENAGINKIYYKTDALVVKVGNTIFPTDKIIPNLNIIVGALKPLQKVHFKFKIVKGTMKKNGSEFMIPTTIGYNFQTNDEELKQAVIEARKEKVIETPDDEKNFIIKMTPRIYKKTNDGQPLIINFCLQTNGNISAEKTFILAIQTLNRRLENVKIGLKNRDEERVIISESKVNFDARDLLFIDEDDTLGNLLNYYLSEDKDFSYSGYLVPHNLERKILLRVSLVKNNTESNIIDKIIKKVDFIQSLLKNLEKDAQTLFKSK